MNEKKKIIVKSKTENLKTVREFVAEFAREVGFDEKAVTDITLAVDEAATNIIKHAYKFDETQDIIVEVGIDNDEFSVSLTDFGGKFDPEKVHLPDIKESLKLKKAGGLGIYLMRTLMDKVVYENTSPDYNKITLIKKIERW